MAKKRSKQPEAVHKQSFLEELDNPELHGVRTKPRASKRAKEGAEQEGEGELPAGLSARVLREAAKQREELEAGSLAPEQLALAAASRAATGKVLAGLADADEDSDSDGSDFDFNGPVGAEADADEDWLAEEAALGPEDQAALLAFSAPDAASHRQRSLAEVVSERMAQRLLESKEGRTSGGDASEEGPSEDLDERAIAVFEGVGRILSRYTAGRLPKALKIIPGLRAWEQALAATDPSSWTPHATLAATKVFVSSFNARLAQRFVALVLLPACRRDIQDHKRLHTALFQALRKTAGYKPAAFYKGFLLPLCASRTCTLREAVIVASLLRRTSIPVLHSAAALLRLGEAPYAGTTSFFIRVLVDKRYALPYRVVDSLVDHFSRFSTEPQQMPVVWHQALLAFVQRYKHEVREEDIVVLRKLVGKQAHPAVTPEIIRELDAARTSRSRARGATGSAAPGDRLGVDAGPDTPARRPVPSVAQARRDAAAGKGEDPRNLAPLIMEEDNE